MRLPGSYLGCECSSSEAEWGGLLPARPSSNGDPVSREKWAGRRVLLTGAGGSIGSALASVLARAGVERLVLLDFSEAALFEVKQTLPEDERNTRLVLGSVCDAELLRKIFVEERPDVVIHAAAYKHVALMEWNALAAVRNNTYGTWLLAQTAAAHSRADFVLISTDKAVHPTSIMGASKRAAELVTLGFAASGGLRAKVVRLCNVIGSRGSVVPLMLRKIREKGTVTVTDPMAARYFITMAEAVAAVVGAVEEEGSGRLFVPADPSEINILALVQQLIAIAAQKGEQQEIQFTGLQCGERLRERLIGDSERRISRQDTTQMLHGLCEINAVGGWTLASASTLGALWAAVQGSDAGTMLHVLREIVPEYEMSSVVQQLYAVEAGVRL
jgi:FlaA1/EpsC-like NDP-sugar epimerase